MSRLSTLFTLLILGLGFVKGSQSASELQHNFVVQEGCEFLIGSDVRDPVASFTGATSSAVSASTVASTHDGRCEALVNPTP